MKQLLKTGLFMSLIALLFLASCTKDNEITNVTVNKSTLQLIGGQTDSIEATVTFTGDVSEQSLTYTSSDTGIVTVKESKYKAGSTRSSYSKTALITGKAAGTATVTLKVGEKTVTCQITVINKLSPAMTQGDLCYYGDPYTCNISNNFTLCLGTKDVNMTDLSGEGEVIFLEFNTALTVTNRIPAGTYEMVNFPVSNFAPYTLVPANKDDNGSPWGTWYFGNTTCAVIGGHAEVSVSDNVYTVEYHLVDYYGNTIEGTYQGTPTYSDKSDSEAASPALVKKANGVNPLMSNKAMRIRR